MNHTRRCLSSESVGLQRGFSAGAGVFDELNIVEGKMQYLFNENGRRYLDAFAGIVTVSCGHCHPDILNAIVEHSKLLLHATTIYLHRAITDFAEALASRMPENLKARVCTLLDAQVSNPQYKK